MYDPCWYDSFVCPKLTITIVVLTSHDNPLFIIKYFLHGVVSMHTRSHLPEISMSFRISFQCVVVQVCEFN